MVRAGEASKASERRSGSGRGISEDPLLRRRRDGSESGSTGRRMWGLSIGSEELVSELVNT